MYNVVKDTVNKIVCIDKKINVFFKFIFLTAVPLKTFCFVYKYVSTMFQHKK